MDKVISRQIESTFCDDIRQESGGKLSFMGVYSGSMAASAFPAILPKFAVFVKILLPVDSGLVKNINVRILQDELVIREVEPNKSNLVEAQKSISNSGDTLTQCSTGIVFSPFHINNPCLLRVVVSIDGQEHRAAALSVIKLEE